LKASGDDFENELPAGAPQPKTYTISLDPDIATEMQVGTVYSYSVEVYEDGVVMTDVPSTDISFTSDNANVTIAYDETSGNWNVSASESASNVTLTVTYKDNLSVITKTTSFVDTYEIKFNELPESIKTTDDPAPFTLSYYKNGEVVSTVSQSDFTVTVDDTSKAEVYLDSNSYYLKPLVAGDITVTATMNDVSATQSVTIIEGVITYEVKFVGLPDSIDTADVPATFTLACYKNGELDSSVSQSDFTVTIDDESKATITLSDDSYTFTPLAEGSCVVTASIHSVSATQTVTITDTTAVYEIKFNGLSSEINTTDDPVSFTLEYYKNGEIVSSVSQSDFTVTVDDESKATVVLNGDSYTFTPLAAGDVVVKAIKGDITAEFTVTIVEAVATYTLEFADTMETTMSLNATQLVELVLKLGSTEVEVTNQKDYTVNSSDSTIVNISYNTSSAAWRMLANKKGTADVTATHTATGATVTQTFTVKGLW